MKKIILIFTFLIGTMFSYGQADQKVADLINSEDFIELSRVYPSLKDSITYPMIGLMAEACMSSAFNQPQRAVQLLDSLLQTYTGELGMANLSSFVLLTCDQLAKFGEYKNAETLVKSMIEVCDDANMLKLLNSSYRRYQGLSTTAKSEVIFDSTKSSVINMVTDIDGAKYHWYVPVEINGVTEPFVFDTGATGSMISKSFAKRHDVRIVADSIMSYGISDICMYTSIGIIDTLKVGNLTYINLPVSVVDNNILPKNIEAILGLDFMTTVGPIKIIPAKQNMELLYKTINNESEIYHPNIHLFGGILVVEAYLNDKRLILDCDTGAARFDGWIKQSVCVQNPKIFNNVEYVNDSITVQGAGGSINANARISSKIPIKLANKEMEYNNFIVLEDGKHDGGVGLEFFRKQKEIVFDMKRMVIRIK